MRRGITTQEVFDAADALLEAGERPTIEKVRKQLGRGSPNTINRMLDAWWGALADRMKSVSVQAVPGSLMELCGTLYSRLRAQARESVEKELAEQRSMLDMESKRLKEAKLGLEADRASVTVLRLKLESELAYVKARHQEMLGSLRDVEYRLSYETARNAHAVREAAKKRRR